MMRFAVEVSWGRLRFAPVMCRRTFYLSLTLGRRSYWLMRWDTARTEGYRHRFAFSRDRLMSWSRGTH